MTWLSSRLVNLGCMSRLVADHAATRRPLVGNKFMSRQDWHVDVESSEMRVEIGLSDYLDPRDEKLTPVELGRRIDDWSGSLH